MQGLKTVVSFPEHRKELVAGNLGAFLTTREQNGTFLNSQPLIFTHHSTEFLEAGKRVGDQAHDFFEQWRIYKLRGRFSLLSMLQDPVRQLPQVYIQ